MNHKPIIYLNFIDRTQIRLYPQCIFVFGDNTARKGLGGQAKEMRGEPNTIGIATKRYPSMDDDAFMSDDNETDRITVYADLAKVVGMWNSGHQIVAPEMGIGTYRAKLIEKAPKLYATIYETFAKMSKDGKCPWPTPLTS